VQLNTIYQEVTEEQLRTHIRADKVEAVEGAKRAFAGAALGARICRRPGAVHGVERRFGPVLDQRRPVTRRLGGVRKAPALVHAMPASP